MNSRQNESVSQIRPMYIKDSDMEVFQKMEKLLEKQGKSVSEFFADAARNFMELNEQTEEIELTGMHRKRVFQGQTLYWRECSDSERGVFRTARGSFAEKESKISPLRQLDAGGGLHVPNDVEVRYDPPVFRHDKSTTENIRRVRPTLNDHDGW